MGSWNYNPFRGAKSEIAEWIGNAFNAPDETPRRRRSGGPPAHAGGMRGIGNVPTIDPVTGLPIQELNRRIAAGPQIPGSGEAPIDPFLMAEFDLIQRGYDLNAEESEAQYQDQLARYRHEVDQYNKIYGNLQARVGGQRQFGLYGKGLINAEAKELQPSLDQSVKDMVGAMAPLTNASNQSSVDVLAAMQSELTPGTGPGALEDISAALGQSKESQAATNKLFSDLAAEYQDVYSRFAGAAGPYYTGQQQQALSTGVNEALTQLYARMADMEKPFLNPSLARGRDSGLEGADLARDRAVLDLLSRIAGSQEEAENPTYEGYQGVQRWADQAGLGPYAGEYFNLANVAQAQAGAEGPFKGMSEESIMNTLISGIGKPNFGISAENPDDTTLADLVQGSLGKLSTTNPIQAPKVAAAMQALDRIMRKQYSG